MRERKKKRQNIHTIIEIAVVIRVVMLREFREMYSELIQNMLHIAAEALKQKNTKNSFFTERWNNMGTYSPTRI